MKMIINPDKNNWTDIARRSELRPAELGPFIQTVFERVKTGGDQVLMEYTKQFDLADLNELSVSEKELLEATIPAELSSAIDLAYNNIYCFHKANIEPLRKVETTKGVTCWRKSIAIDDVGLYIPGGTAPLFSTALMLVIPALIAGCKNIILCTPPNRDGQISPAILYVAKKAGINKIFKVGGAQAIAAMSLGTETIPRVSKIFGPGNQYVTEAKRLSQRYGTQIDMPAGPSEVLVVADETANARFIAADLLSQAEHGIDSQSILLTNSKALLIKVNDEIVDQLESLPRKEIAKSALNNSKLIYFPSLTDCMAFSNFYAPEHLIINTDNAEDLSTQVMNAGSVFLGQYSCESAGDYASGTNHTLPTNGYAKSYSGVSVDSFVKKVTFQKLTKEGIQNIGPAIEILAEAENLTGHKRAVSYRLNQIGNEGN